jgi:hypothetical protein
VRHGGDWRFRQEPAGSGGARLPGGGRGQQASGSSVYGGGAIFDEGGQLKVVNSAFTGDSCFASGPDLGGGAVRAVGMYPASPVYVTGGTVMRDNSAREGGGGIFFVVNSGGGTLRIESSTLQDNPSGAFQNAPGIFDSVNGQDSQPVEVGSAVG